MIDLTGKVALVTGSARGIGRSCAIALAEAGADVVINYISSKDAAMDVGRQIHEMGRSVAVIRADVSEREDVNEMIDEIKMTFGSLDIVVSNAATGGFRPLIATTEQNFEAAMNINVRPVLYLLQAALPLLELAEQRAKVIAISSHGSFLALPMYGTIGTSKAALESLMRHMALELGNKGINFNIVRSGLVPTDSTRRLPGADEMFAGREHKSMTGSRMLEAEDVANAVLFLASPLSDLVQGETLTVDGGAAVHI